MSFSLDDMPLLRTSVLFTSPKTTLPFLLLPLLTSSRVSHFDVITSLCPFKVRLY